MDEWLPNIKEYETSGTYGGRRVIKNEDDCGER